MSPRQRMLCQRSGKSEADGEQRGSQVSTLLMRRKVWKSRLWGRRKWSETKAAIERWTKETIYFRNCRIPNECPVVWEGAMCKLTLYRIVSSSLQFSFEGKLQKIPHRSGGLVRPASL